MAILQKVRFKRDRGSILAQLFAKLHINLRFHNAKMIVSVRSRARLEPYSMVIAGGACKAPPHKDGNRCSLSDPKLDLYP